MLTGVFHPDSVSTVMSAMPISKFAARLCASLVGVWALAAVAQAQVAVTSVRYSTTIVNGADTTVGGVTFRQEYDAPVSVMTASLGNYQFNGPVAESVTVRRNTSEAGPNNSTVFYQTDSNGKAYGNSETDIGSMFLSNNLYEGLRNPFANGSGSLNSNIERIDFRLTNYVVQANDAMVFFDIENAGNFGDGFRIAAFTSWGSVNGTQGPTAYANTGLMVNAGSFGGPIDSPSDGINGTFERATYTNGDTLSGTPTIGSLNGTALNLVGILIRFSDLGIAPGTTIQGFSLMAGDTAPTTAASLVNWNTTSVYPTNTDPNTYGNMDFMAFGAQVSRPIPEPSTYGAIFAGMGLSVWLWRRKKQKSAATAATV